MKTIIALAALCAAGCGGPETTEAQTAVQAPVAGVESAKVPVSDFEATKSAALCLGWPPAAIPSLEPLSQRDDLALHLGYDPQRVQDMLATLEPKEVTIDRYGMCGRPMPADRHPDMDLPHAGVFARTQTSLDIFVIVLTKTTSDGSRTFVSLSGEFKESTEPVVPPISTV
jgi:hypothetical protein